MAMCYGCYADLEKFWGDQWVCPVCGHIYYIDEDEDEIIDEEYLSDIESDEEPDFPEEFYDSL